jgi:thiamine biosynthesis lipoprotein
MASTAAAQLQRFEYRQVAMAIEARVVLYAPDDATAKAAAAAAFAELDRLDAMCSDYREDSALRRLCDRAREGDASVPRGSDDLSGLLSLAWRLRQASGGAFDVSVGPLTRLWREARSTGTVPEKVAIDDALARVGRWAILVRAGPADESLLTFGRGTSFDLGGIAKGYAVGAAVEACQRAGGVAAMIEMGGDIVAGEAPPGGSGWVVSVPGGSGSRPRELLLSRAAVAVSGDSQQFVEWGGARYGHVIDVRNGWPTLTGRQALAVVRRDAVHSRSLGESGAVADAMATTASLVGAPEAQRLAFVFDAESVTVEDPAFRPLFDGASLANWTPRGGRYDGDALWSVEDGCITGRTGPGDAGGLLYTQAPFTSFELQLECKLESPFDSGIFVRMAPDARGAQLTLDDRPDGEIGAVFSDGFLAHARPEAAAAWRRGEWNHVFLRCTGFDLRLQAWINGVPVMDHVVPQEFGPDGRPVFAPGGLIGLQVHGGGSEGAGHAARFRDIQVRELPVHGEDFARDRALAPPEREARAARRSADGWRDLLAPAADGADPLSAWEGVHGDGPPHAPADYFVRDGVLHIPSSDPPGTLRTKRDFRDFDLTLQFRQARMSNSGLFLRGRRDAVGPDGALVPGGNPAFSGCEIQIIDDWNWEAGTQSTLKDWQFTGSLYGAVPPARKGLLAPIGEWNVLEVTARGSRMACALNGQALWDVDTHALAVEPPFAARAAEGFLGLQRYAAPGVTDAAALEVRELWVRER